jgi:hypothetical protein
MRPRRDKLPMVHIRVTQELLDELEGLLPLVREHVYFRGGTVTTQDVYRLALSRGAEILKQEMAREDH